MIDKLIEKIVFNEKKNTFIDELKENKLPVLLYGGGSYARDVLKYLKERGILIDKVFADDILKDILEDYSLERISIDDVSFPCVVVMGFAKYLMGKELAVNNSYIKKVYYPVLMPYEEIGGYTKSAVLAMMPEYQKVYELLEDDFSRKCMVAFLNSRINEDASYCFECFEREQTYFNNSVFKARNNENYLDIGTYTGDTIKLYARDIDGNLMGHIWGIEADKSLEMKIREAVHEIKADDITELFFVGLWNKKKTIYFNRTDYSDEEGYVSEESGEGRQSLEVDTLDHILASRKKRVTLLKINFCDAEKIIEGGQGIIKEDLPKLAIVVAFGSEMIARIPSMIKKINPKYKVYLRFNSPMPARIVCYAVIGE